MKATILVIAGVLIICGAGLFIQGRIISGLGYGLVGFVILVAVVTWGKYVE